MEQPNTARRVFGLDVEAVAPSASVRVRPGKDVVDVVRLNDAERVLGDRIGVIGSRAPCGEKK